MIMLELRRITCPDCGFEHLISKWNDAWLVHNADDDSHDLVSNIGGGRLDEPAERP